MIRLIFLSALLAWIPNANAQWQPVESSDGSKAIARHEAGFVETGGKFYLIGGRRIQHISIYDPVTARWTIGAKPPVEIHHVQPVVYQEKIWLAGAFTGTFPNETPLAAVYVYDPRTDQWATGPSMPTGRARGAAGAVVVGNSLYVIAGATNGHVGGHVAWVDRYDFMRKAWVHLPDAPRPRDHFQAASDGNAIYVAGGRLSMSAPDTFKHTIAEVDRFDLAADSWTILPEKIMTGRAGSMSLFADNKLWLAGGESMMRNMGHAEVEVLGPERGPWASAAALIEGRHGTGLIKWNGHLWTASGSGKRGGEPELTTMERLPLDKAGPEPKEPYLKPLADGNWPNPNPTPGNPFVETLRAADPDAHVFDGKVWVYTSQDHDPPEGQRGYSAMDGYHVFSSTDLVNWTDHGEILNASNNDWGLDEGGFMWAPGVCRKDGKYFLYYPHKDKARQWVIGLAIGNSPAGPFKDIGRPIAGTSGIDPMCFIDDDGKAYLYFGIHKVARLSDDMTSLAETARDVDYGAQNFREGAYMAKRNGVYYYSYTDFEDKEFQGYYAMGRNPYGPFEYKGPINRKPPGAQDHHSMIEFMGRWYYFYHVGNFTNAAGFRGRGNRRNASIDYMYFNDDGTIRMIEQTANGVAPIDNQPAQ